MSWLTLHAGDLLAACAAALVMADFVARGPRWGR